MLLTDKILNEKGCSVNPTQCSTADLISRYLILTKEVMPQMARDPGIRWPVHNDHCFQRIILDIVCNGVWYEHLARPAYKHLSREQAIYAVQLCEDIIANRADLQNLNLQSLMWRGKRGLS